MSTAPARTEVEDLREALEEAADSLETVMRWNRCGELHARGTWDELRAWARGRAGAARRALATEEDPVDESHFCHHQDRSTCTGCPSRATCRASGKDGVL